VIGGFMKVLVVLLAPLFAGAQTLGSYNVAAGSVTVSGVSSGAFMALQMEVAYSASISGAASVAGGIYWCAKGDANRAQTTCMSQPAGVQTAEHVAEARRSASAGLIDPVENLQHHSVYVYSSTKDYIINPGHSDKIQEFYRVFGARVRFDRRGDSAHGFPTLDQGAPCGMGMPPWLLKCGYDAAGEILAFMYGSLQPRGAFDPGHLHTFAQSEFGSPLFASGWVYVPDSCAKGASCRLHVALHGCQMNPEFIQDQFARLAGYNEWAETNGIIVLYPQSAKVAGVNPYACWDWFGFTGSDYAVRSGAQMVALKRMMDRVSGR
jgi:hypothetical protein